MSLKRMAGSGKKEKILTVTENSVVTAGGGYKGDEWQ